ncbi:alpha/beta fold hydrolase [Vibrio sp. B1FLJ16]|uniref:alpha/beta fold hydrolase n=1 Tax=Vibrio sp. B1FLJ16 TaxID=2751178 RepID=UPI0015F67C15|nr:alpha/beta fold hydrolase [Vibrio sp. B1FLJ16]CAD7801574.1 PGAP1-like protein [Vibrio sp. B1FLJ16]CAD7801617.1 PGAP1-like protein [Vibrio sp. B1FLJ16]CAE6890450.1 PGAP1-like protein [Vibrio sp. B1FLJ16]CAE6891476.1 PGAP1-like protein [Vibrio sp. B1FLJ16]
MSALLNYKQEGQGQTVVLIHGLFGSLSNLGLLARDLVQDHSVISVDLRNHGLSFHSDTHTYTEMAQDVANLLGHLDVEPSIIVGHSMGGKVAMKLADIAPQFVKQLVVLDMAPVAYTTNRHENVFNGLRAVIEQEPTNRQQAMDILAQHIEIDGVRQFLSKSLYKEGNKMAWRFNVKSLSDNYAEIIGWQEITPTEIPTLFVKGGDSDYLMPEHQAAVQKQFKQAKAHIIANTGHWLHAEKPAEVMRAIRKYITA